MRSDVLKVKLDKIIKWAFSNNTRLLIEVELSGKIYIYVDKINYTTIAAKASQLKLDKVKWVLTDEKICYHDVVPRLRFLSYDKGDVKKRFYDDGVKVIKETCGNNIIYFVGDIEKKAKDSILLNWRVAWEDVVNIDWKTLQGYGLLNDVIINRIDNRTFAVYNRG